MLQSVSWAMSHPAADNLLALSSRPHLGPVLRSPSVRAEPQFGCTYYKQLFLLCSIGGAVYKHSHNFRAKQAQQLMDKLQLRSIPYHKKKHSWALREDTSLMDDIKTIHGLRGRFSCYSHLLFNRVSERLGYDITWLNQFTGEYRVLRSVFVYWFMEFSLLGLLSRI